MTENQSETQPESTPVEQNVEAEQVVVNNAPDGGGVDNEAAPEAPAAESESTDSE